MGVLLFGVVGEQVKTRLEVASEGRNTRDVSESDARDEVVSPSGLAYRDVRIGGGQSPRQGDIVALHYRGSTARDGQVFYDTHDAGKPIVFIYGSRPFAGGVCDGVEEALKTMRAGGRRVVDVPSELGFGERGLVMRGTRHVAEKGGAVAADADLVYDLELVRVSIAPS